MHFSVKGIMLTPWLSSLQNNPNLENPIPTECLSGQHLVTYFVWEHISKVVQQSGNTKEIKHVVSVGLPAYIADKLLEEVIFSIKCPSNNTVFKIHSRLKLSYHMENIFYDRHKRGVHLEKQYL